MRRISMETRGQVAIFVIIALVIVGAIIVLFAYPKLSSVIAPKELSPEQYLRDCIQPDVKGAIELLARQGGEQNPVGYINYLDTKVKYLCYISGYYKPCLIMQPMLITNFENELSKILTPKADACARSLVSEYERRGYSVSAPGLTSNISLSPGKVKIIFNAPMTITSAGTTRTFDKFDSSINSEIYNLLSIATSIIDYESTYGDSETTAYLRYYPDLSIDKIKLEDGVKIYKLTNVVTNEMFQFATRSLVWPPGYGLG
jgi:hypothetical protein